MMYRTAPGTRSLDPARILSLNSAPKVRCGKAEWVKQRMLLGYNNSRPFISYFCLATFTCSGGICSLQS